MIKHWQEKCQSVSETPKMRGKSTGYCKAFALGAKAKKERQLQSFMRYKQTQNKEGTYKVL